MTDTLLIRALAFAAHKHRHQKRKGDGDIPYVNHVIDVLAVLGEAGIDDAETLSAAVLHDTIEDTDATYDEIAALFGVITANLVMEVTDDKTLPKQLRKQLQIDRAGLASPKARLIKLADKIANLRDMAVSPPDGWPRERIVEYIEWAGRVVDNLRGTHAALEALFDAARDRAAKAHVPL